MSSVVALDFSERAFLLVSQSPAHFERGTSVSSLVCSKSSVTKKGFDDFELP